MTKKYIVELPDSTEWIQWIMKGKDGHPYMDFKQVEDITPYTEPDKDALDNAYAHGYSDAEADFHKVKEEIREEAYQKGLEDAKKGRENDYENGLIEAWDAARKISLMSPEEAEQVFPGAKKYNRFNLGYSGVEVISRLTEYEARKEREIKIGDEVAFHHDDRPDTVVVITHIGEDGFIDGMDGKGTLYAHKNPDKWTKTGRHFPEIAEAIKKMREENDD